jgi:coproporphyrinogen III oxidase-like Fe-S oxidoreductase
MSLRSALHDRYSRVARIGDASRLAYLHGPTTVWTEEEVAALWARARPSAGSHAAPSSDGQRDPLNCLYIHVPFCKSICHFCNYDRLQPSSPQLLKTWLDRALRTLAVIGPAVRPLTFHALYMGGGTPSVLPAKLLRELLHALDTTITWHPQASRKMEFDPAVMSRERLDVLAAHGFDQLSFGIETLDPEINARHNRGRQSIDTIERSFVDLRAVGISDVACDFLLGLEGTTPAGMLAEMETVLTRFSPAWVDIFMLTPTASYVERHFGGSREGFWAHLRPFEQAIPAALPALAERTGYLVRMGQGHHMMLMRRDGGRSQAQFPYTALTTEARRPLNVLGLGRSARSSIFGVAAFALRDPRDDPSAAGPADYEGHAIDLADEARAFLVHRLRDTDTVDRREFQEIFGDDMSAIISHALAGWESEGTARLEADVLRFVPQERRARIHSLLWLVPQQAIEFDLARIDDVPQSAPGIERLVASLKSGTRLADGHTFAGAEDGRILVRTPSGEVLRFRVAPALRDAGPLRLVLEEAPRTANTDGLRRAVGQLRGVLSQRHRELVRHRPAAPSPTGDPRATATRLPVA